MKTINNSIILIVTFTITFLLATLIFDSFEKQIGYYNEGLAASRSWNE